MHKSWIIGKYSSVSDMLLSLDLWNYLNSTLLFTSTDTFSCVVCGVYTTMLW